MQVVEVYSVAPICTMYYGEVDTDYGSIIVFFHEYCVYGLHFLVQDRQYYLRLARKKFCQASFIYNAYRAKQCWDRVTGGGAIYITLQGTGFQCEVWRSLLKIRRGEVMSYQDIAYSIGRGVGYARAVGKAVSQNFIAMLVPCHRIVGSGSSIRGYRWGVEKKEMLLAKER